VLDTSFVWTIWGVYWWGNSCPGSLGISQTSYPVS